MSFPRTIHGSEAEVYNTSSSEDRSKIGQKMVIEDGRVFRFSLADSTALVAALLNQAAIPEVAKYGDQAVGTIAVGETVLTGVGSATSNLAASELINGYCWSEQTTQLGPAARIEDNTLITAAAETGTITLHNPLSVAIAAGDTISYIRNTWRNVIVYPTTETGQVAGVTVSAIPASNYGWLQTAGPAKIQTSGSIVVTAPIIGAGAAAGEVTVGSAATDDVIGYFMHWEQADEDGLFFLTIES